MVQVAKAPLPSAHTALVSQNGQVSSQWYSFFLNLFNSAQGISAELDTIISSAGALVYRGASLWTGLGLGSSGQVLIAGDGQPEWGLIQGAQFGPESANLFLAGPLTGAAGDPTFRAITNADLANVSLEGLNFGPQSANQVLAGPASGAATDPAFRALVSDDLPAGEYPGTDTNDSASAGNVGEYFQNTSPFIGLSSGAAADIGQITLTAGDWDVWGTIVSSPGSGATPTYVKAWLNTAPASDPGPPNGGAYWLNQDAAGGSGLETIAPIGMKRLSLAGTATVYISCLANFSGGTMQALGFIAARRAR